MTALENVLVGMHVRLKGNLFEAIVRTPRVKREERRGAEARARAARVLGAPAQGRARSARTSRTATSAGSRSRARSRRSRSCCCSTSRPPGMNPQETADFTSFVGRLREEQRARGAADRARHARRHGHLRPRDGARLRREDRRGHAAGDPAERARDRGVPRQRGGERRERERRAAAAQLDGHRDVLRLDPGAEGRSRSRCTRARS